MSPVKKQHYVPQFYLRRFATTGERIYVYDKFSKTAFASRVHDVAASNYFHDLSLETIAELQEAIQKEQAQENIVDQLIRELLDQTKEEVQPIEKYLNRFEDRFKIVIDKVVEGLESQKIFKQEYRSEVALMAAIQLWRTPARRESMKEKLEKVIGITSKPDLAATGHKLMMLNRDALERSAQALQRHIWLIGLNETDNPFYTSDNPVVTRPLYTGIASSGVEVFLPLTPKYILIMAERTFFRSIEHQDGSLAQLNQDKVTLYNSLQVYSSYRQLYSIENNFELVEEMLNKEPDL